MVNILDQVNPQLVNSMLIKKASDALKIRKEEPGMDERATKKMRGGRKGN